jgi:hypothetical protein
MRRRLVTYFERKRCLAPDDLADETLNRVARRLAERGAIDDAPPARYCYIVARYVFLEYLRRPEPSQPPIGADVARVEPPSDEVDARRHHCLEQCLQELSAVDRELILDYYRGEQAIKIARRRALAARLGLTANALAIRACRIRDRLEGCVRACLARR